MRQFVKLSAVGCIGTAAFLSAAAHSEQCDNHSTNVTASAVPAPAWAIDTPAWMDVDATGVVVNGAVAAGTAAAAIAAVWAVLSDRRRKRREDLVVARLIAGGVSTRLDIAAEVIHEISKAFDFLTKGDLLSSESAMNMRESIESIERVTFDEIKSMVPLRGDCAALIAAAQDRLHVAQGNLHFLSVSVSPNAQRLINIDRCGRALRESSALFERAKAICDAESNRIDEVLKSAQGD